MADDQYHERLDELDSDVEALHRNDHDLGAQVAYVRDRWEKHDEEMAALEETRANGVWMACAVVLAAAAMFLVVESMIAERGASPRNARTSPRGGAPGKVWVSQDAALALRDQAYREGYQRGLAVEKAAAQEEKSASPAEPSDVENGN